MPKLTRRQFLQLSTAGAVGATLPNLGRLNHNKDQERPNIIVILADDTGFSDAGCYGGEIQTPNLDRMAEGGLRFSDFHNTARCCPTRASLLTGQYQHKVGMPRMANNGSSLNRNGVTIAEALKEAGYKTSMYGKWHLSGYQPLDDKQKQLAWLNHQYDPGRPFSPRVTYPAKRGFDDFYGVIWGVVDHYDPFSLVDGMEPVDEVPDDYHITDAITNRSVQKIDDYSQQEDPFFMYVSYTAPHWPLHARKDDIAKYKHTFKEGWNVMRSQRFKRLVELGFYDKASVNLPNVQDGGNPWEKLSAQEKEFEANKMATHAAMVDQMDRGIGKIMNTLEENDQLDNTLILFLSDNGASPELPKNWGPGLDRPSETRDGRKIRYSGVKQPGPETTYVGLGPGWASASNTPFRYWKAESYEGGAHTPCIAHWPAGLKTKPGAITNQRGHVMDILPTCLDLAGAEYPDKYKGHDISSADGHSLAPIFEGRQREGYDQLFFEHEGGKALIDGKWKIVALRKKNAPWRLYNLEDDPTETVDISDTNAQKLKSMTQDWADWAKDMGLEGPEA